MIHTPKNSELNGRIGKILSVGYLFSDDEEREYDIELEDNRQLLLKESQISIIL